MNKEQRLRTETVTLEGYMDRLIAQRKTFLFEVEPIDLRIFAGALTTLAAAGLLASAVPARRAA